MKCELISIFDKKAKTYTPPRFYTHRAYMTRDFQDLLRKETVYSNNIDDFQVFFLGNFDDFSGALVAPKNGPELIGELSAFKPV